MIKEWGNDGVRPMIYMNPYIANLTGSSFLRQNQFEEGIKNGYFIMHQDGSPYLLQSLSIEMAIIDLKNPEAWEWTKKIIQDNLIDEAGAWGWMHDFGEYVPLDSTNYAKDDPFMNHNDFPAQWAKVVKEAIAESKSEHAKEVVPFMRSGSTMSPADTKLFWMGD